MRLLNQTSTPSGVVLGMSIRSLNQMFRCSTLFCCSHMIAPTFQQLSQKARLAAVTHSSFDPNFKFLHQFAHVQFLKVDVDKVQAIAQKYKVSAMPTFIVIKGGKVVGEVRPDCLTRGE
jgi:thiol-disulfide isomerase/thioredoxin